VGFQVQSYYRIPTKFFVAQQAPLELNFGMLSSTNIASPIEFPKASEIRIRTVSNKTSGKKLSLSYRVNQPTAVTGNGRTRRQFLSLRSFYFIFTI
jgi:hypothetical protein